MASQVLVGDLTTLDFVWGRCSILLKRTGAPITYISDVRSFFEKEKAPGADGTAQGSSS